jgi:hypothetical protein
VTADAQGQFSFDSVEPAANGWMIAVSASSSDGSLFAVSYLVSAGAPVNQSSQGDQIVAGTDVGNIAVFPSAARTLTAVVTSQDSTGADQDIEVAINPLRTSTFDRNVQLPRLNVPTPFATSATTPGCDSQGSCGMAHCRCPVELSSGLRMTIMGITSIHSQRLIITPFSSMRIPNRPETQHATRTRWKLFGKIRTSPMRISQTAG